MNALPPPLPSYGVSKNNQGFARGAATACLLSPLLVIGLGQALKHAGGALAGRNLVLAVAAFGGVSCLLMLAGLILGILALLLMRPGERASIVVRSLLGLAATGLIVAMAVPNFQHARAQVQARLSALNDVQSAFKDRREQSVASLTNYSNQPTNSSRAEQTPGAAAQNSPGDAANGLRASQAYARHVQAILADYENAHDALVTARVLTTSNLVERSAIAEREAVVQRFLACNEALRDFINRGSTNYRAELLAFHVSDAGTASALAGFERAAAQKRSLLADILAQDDRTAEAMLGVLGLLDTDWGRWHYTTNAPHLRFANRADLDQYNTYLTEIREARVIQQTAAR